MKIFGRFFFLAAWGPPSFTIFFPFFQCVVDIFVLFMILFLLYFFVLSLFFFFFFGRFFHILSQFSLADPVHDVQRILFIIEAGQQPQQAQRWQ